MVNLDLLYWTSRKRLTGFGRGVVFRMLKGYVINIGIFVLIQSILSNREIKAVLNSHCVSSFRTHLSSWIVFVLDFRQWHSWWHRFSMLMTQQFNSVSIISLISWKSSSWQLFSRITYGLLLTGSYNDLFILAKVSLTWKIPSFLQSEWLILAFMIVILLSFLGLTCLADMNLKRMLNPFIGLLLRKLLQCDVRINFHLFWINLRHL